MYVIGHCVTTAASGVFEVEALFREDAIALSFPDYACCHGWGYQTCFEAVPQDHRARLVRAHMIGDWWAHHGEGSQAGRGGWAYRNMEIYARRHHAYFRDAFDRGLRPDPDPTDSCRGFAHTMMEYTMDTWLARRHVDRIALEPLQRSLASIRPTSGEVSAAVQDIYRGVGLEVQDSAALCANIDSFVGRIERARALEELAYRAGIKKFGLKDCPDAVEFMRTYLDQGLTEIDDVEIADAVRAAAAFIAAHFGVEPETGRQSWI